MKRIKNFLLVVVLSAVALAGCKKIEERNSLLSHTDTDKLVSREGRPEEEIDWPVVANGMLKFRDMEHFDRYQDQLTDFLINDSLSTDSLTVEEVLANIENSLGYNSFRAFLEKTKDVELRTNSDGFITANTTIPDLINQSVYNADKNVQVGESVNHIFDEDLAIFIRNGEDETLLNEINHIPASASHDEIESRFLFNSDVTVYSRRVTPLLKEITHGNPLSDTSWFADFYSERYSSGCSDPKTVKIPRVGLGAQGIDNFSIYNGGINNHSLDVFVDWGDGSSQIYNGLPAQIWPIGGTQVLIWPSIPDKHVYANYGNYTITVKVKRPYHSTWAASASHAFTLSSEVCAHLSYRKSGTFWKYTGNGHQAVSGQCGLHQNFWGHWVFWADTKGYHMNSGHADHHKVDQLISKVWLDSYDNCNGSPVPMSDYCDRSRSKSISVRTSRTNGGLIYFSVMHSLHILRYGSEYVQLQLDLPSCE
jgi:hypothetical protein